MIEITNDQKHEAAVLYIKHGYTFREVAAHFEVSTMTVKRWSDEGKWQDLRQDFTYDRKGDERHAAGMLFIKSGLSAHEISKQLKVSMQLLKKWIDDGKWNELRPELNFFQRIRAANMYIEGQLSTVEISQKLSVDEMIVKIWVSTYRWEPLRKAKNSQNIAKDTIEEFCKVLSRLLPYQSSAIEIAKFNYLESLNPYDNNPA